MKARDTSYARALVIVAVGIGPVVRLTRSAEAQPGTRASSPGTAR